MSKRYHKRMRRIVGSRNENQVVSILTPDDYSDYTYNKPGDKWELVRFQDGSRAWVGKNTLYELEPVKISSL